MPEGPTLALHVGDCVEVMGTMPEASVDAVVTDPPYGLEFMGKDWDQFAAPKTATERSDHMNRSTSYGPWGRRDRPIAPNTYGHRNERCLDCGKWRISSNRCECVRPRWEYRIAQAAPESMLALQAWTTDWTREVLRVLKPGAHLLTFGGTRTFHRLTVAIEDAGFEVRDCLMWLYGSGFPKSRAVLKPAWEPIMLARKPLIGTVAQNVESHGTGALNIDATRIGTTDDTARGGLGGFGSNFMDDDWQPPERVVNGGASGGRWPPNVALDEQSAALLDAQVGESVSRVGQPRTGTNGDGWGLTATGAEYADSGGPSRFFYTAKASRAEREAGFDDRSERSNDHPTVKPVDLMRWLVRLVAPPGGTVLDPFLGSGTTGMAALDEGFDFIGIDQEEHYVEIARRRIEHRHLLAPETQEPDEQRIQGRML